MRQGEPGLPIQLDHDDDEDDHEGDDDDDDEGDNEGGGEGDDECEGENDLDFLCRRRCRTTRQLHREGQLLCQ